MGQFGDPGKLNLTPYPTSAEIGYLCYDSKPVANAYASVRDHVAEGHGNYGHRF